MATVLKSLLLLSVSVCAVPQENRVYKLTDEGVEPPRLIHKVAPEYSREAQEAKVEGRVVLRAEIDAKGRVRRVRVTVPLGWGLDEKAIEAIRRWRFEPATKDGKPVPVDVPIEVNMRLL